jgi:hypothetical protein
MFNDLTNLGYGLVVFAIIIGVGSIVLYNFAGATGCKDANYPTWNATDNLCTHTNGSTTAAGGASYDNTDYLLGQLGQSGLAGWTPAIIAISVGILFLGAFMIRGGSNKSKGRY